MAGEMLRALDEYFFRVHHAVRLDPWNNNIGLLDILLKNKDGSLKRVGNILSASDGDWKSDSRDWDEESREDLENVIMSLPGVAEKHDDPRVKKSGSPSISAEVKATRDASASILGAGLAKVIATFVDSKAFTFEASDVSYEKVLEDFLLAPLKKDTPEWEPNANVLDRMGWKVRHGKKDLWIVTEIKYATRLHLSCSKSKGGSAEITASPVVGAEQSGIGTEAKLKRTSSGNWEVKCEDGKPFAIALKAFRLIYSETHELIPIGGIDTSIGNRRLDVRGDHDRDINIPGPDDDPEYHMQDMLQKNSDGDLVCLPFEESA